MTYEKYDYWKDWDPPCLTSKEWLPATIWHYVSNEILIEDVYGNWIPRRPSYPTLDGLSFEEWNAKHEKVKVEEPQ